jgi:hypothetical protein
MVFPLRPLSVLSGSRRTSFRAAQVLGAALEDTFGGHLTIGCDLQRIDFLKGPAEASTKTTGNG